MKRSTTLITVLGIILLAVIVSQGAVALQTAQPDTALAKTTVTESAAESQEKAAKIQQESAQLQELLAEYERQYPGQISLSVFDLENGASAAVGADDPMVAASLYKLYVAFGIYQLIDKGTITPETYVSAAGTTVQSCLEAMLTVSDNPCGEALGGLVGWQELDKALASLGLNSTTTNNLSLIHI